MKKFLRYSLFAALALTFFACKNDVNEGESDSSVTTISANVETVSAQKSASYSEDVSIDLSNNPLKDEVVSSLKEGDDVSEFFTQSKVTATNSRAATTANDEGLENFKAVLKSITKVKIEVTITAQTPNEDCNVLITAVVAAEKTESGTAEVSLVKQVSVGEGVGTISTASLSLSGGTTPSASDMAGKILKFLDNDEYRVKYYQFDSTGTSITVYRYSYSSNNLSESKYEKYVYNGETGELADEDGGSSGFGKEYLSKVGDNYYIFNSLKLSRSSGSGLNSTFTCTLSINEKATAATANEEEITLGTTTGTAKVAMTTTEAGTFTMKEEVNYSFTLSEEGKAFVEEYKEDISEGTHSEVGDMVGVYVNDGGIITAKGKSIVTNSKGETETYEFDEGTAFYDGTSIYFGDKLTAVSESDMQAGK